MADVFISYKREDRLGAAALCRVLQSRGLTVWWDTSLRAGEAFTSTILGELLSARVVLVLWSRRAAASAWVNAEASLGLARGNLVPVNLDRTPSSERWSHLHVLDLSRWALTDFAPECDELIASVELMLTAGAPQPVDQALIIDPSTGQPLPELFELASHGIVAAPLSVALQVEQRSAVLKSCGLLAAIAACGSLLPVFLAPTQGQLSGAFALGYPLGTLISAICYSLLLKRGIPAAAGWGLLGSLIAAVLFFLVGSIGAIAWDPLATYLWYACCSFAAPSIAYFARRYFLAAKRQLALGPKRQFWQKLSD